MNLAPAAKSITLIHRRDVFRAHEESIDWLLNRSSVDTRLFWEMRRLEEQTRLNERSHVFAFWAGLPAIVYAVLLGWPGYFKDDQSWMTKPQAVGACRRQARAACGRGSIRTGSVTSSLA